MAENFTLPPRRALTAATAAAISFGNMVTDRSSCATAQYLQHHKITLRSLTRSKFAMFVTAQSTVTKLLVEKQTQ